MDLDLLVARLTRAILTELHADTRETVLLFAARDRQLPEGLSTLLDQKVRIIHYDEPYHDEDIHRFILPCLHIDQMVDLALGKGGSKLMHGVRQILLSGQKVEVFQWEYRKFQKTAPLPLIDLYEQYRTRLNGFGLVDWLCAANKPFRFSQNVLTEAEVHKARDQGVTQIGITANCRITPLAHETARDLGIRISSDSGGIV